MLIQKIEIQKPNNSFSKAKKKLTHSSSSCQLQPNKGLNKLYNLPFLPNDTKIKKDLIKLRNLNVYDLRNINNNNINNNVEPLYLIFKPKRLVKIKSGPTDIPFQDFRYLPLNKDKVFKSIEKENNQNFSQQLINCTPK